jgi:hypothetical protein
MLLQTVSQRAMRLRSIYVELSHVARRRAAWAPSRRLAPVAAPRQFRSQACLLEQATPELPGFLETYKKAGLFLALL